MLGISQVVPEEIFKDKCLYLDKALYNLLLLEHKVCIEDEITGNQISRIDSVMKENICHTKRAYSLTYQQFSWQLSSMTVTVEDVGLETNKTGVRDKGKVSGISRTENERPKTDSSNGNENKRIDSGRASCK